MSMSTQKNNNTLVNKPIFNIPASFLADTSLSSLAKSAFVEKNEANKKASSTLNKSVTTTLNNTKPTSNNNKNYQYTTTNSSTSTSFAAKKPTLHLISLEEKLQMSNVNNSSNTLAKSPQITVAAITTPNNKKKNSTPKKKKKHSKEGIPQIALEKSPSTPPVNIKDLQQGKHSSEQEVFSDDCELEDRATVVLLSARSKYSTTLTSPRSSVSLSSSVSSDDCCEAYQSSQKAKLLSLDEEEEYQAKSTNAKLKKSNQKLKKRVQTLTEEHNASLVKLSKIQEELVTLKNRFEKELEDSKSSSAKKIDLLIDRTQHFKAKMKKTREELAQIEVNVIIPLRQSLEKKSAEFEAIIESMKAQLKEQHAQDEISWKRILNEKELDFTTRLELLQREQQSALLTELTLRSELEKIVEARNEEISSLNHTFQTIQQLLHQKQIDEQELINKSKSREEELLELLHQKELENQRILQENAMLKKQVETLSNPKNVEVAEWKQQLAIPQTMEFDKSAPASLSVWRKMHGNGHTNNALRGTLANFLNNKR